MDLFSNLKDFGDTLYIRATVNVRKNDCKIEHHEDGSKLIRIYVTEQAQGGRANKAVIRILAHELGIAKSRLQITHGHQSRDKIIAILKTDLLT